MSAKTSLPKTSPWIKAFVVFHVIAIVSWCIPDPPAKPVGTDHLRVLNTRYLKDSPIKYYLNASGFWQGWDMFSPNPSSVDIYGTADIVYRDGTTKKYQYPRMYLLPLYDKYVQERYRKFYERACLGQYRYLWPIFAQRIALLSYTDSANPPVKVRLHKHSLTIEPPGKPQPTEYTDEMYYSHVVDQARLREDAE
jgi:hypothetical protein